MADPEIAKVEFNLETKECNDIAHDLIILQLAGCDRSELIFPIADLEALIQIAKGEFELVKRG